MGILITGGAGFIGSRFVNALERNLDFMGTNAIIDKLTYAGNVKNIEDTTSLLFINDIADENIGKIFDYCEIDMVVNFAAETHVDRSIRNPTDFVRTDILGLTNLIQTSMQHRVKKFIHIDTDEVYGSIEEGEATEDYPLNPTSPYSASKASGSLLLNAYNKTYGFPSIIIRPCNQFGENQYPEKLIPMTIMRLLNGQKAILHGEGKEIREWEYVGNTINYIFRIIRYSKTGEIYNLGSGLRLTNLEVITHIIKIMFGEKANIEDYIERVPNRPGNDSRYAICSEKIKSLLNNNAKVDFMKGLESTINWYRNNMNHWEDVNIDANIYKTNDGYLR